MSINAVIVLSCFIIFADDLPVRCCSAAAHFVAGPAYHPVTIKAYTLKYSTTGTFSGIAERCRSDPYARMAC